MISDKDNFIARPQPSTKDEIDQALKELDRRKQEWVNLHIDVRIKIVEDVRRDFTKVMERFSQRSVLAKGVAKRKLGNDMEWLEIALIARIHSVVHRSLCEIRDHGRPRIPNRLTLHPDNRVKVQVYPVTRLHGMIFRGITHEVWIEPGLDIDEVISGQAEKYLDKSLVGGVALVLGAGNASPLPPSDTFHKLFHDLRVVALKMNPVNSYLGPLFEEAYRSLIERGYLRILYGGATEGSYLVGHPLVEECHMTGSDKTFDTIVFGTGEEGTNNKIAKNPQLKKPLTGELGCITPWIVVPGPWTMNEVELAASRMAFWMVRHEGYLCFAPRILVLQRDWEHRRLFLDVLAESLKKVETIRAYYPGSIELQRTFIREHPNSIEIGGLDENHIPWTIIEGVDSNSTNDICFQRESFSGLCAETSLSAESPTEFLDLAVRFLNDTVWGNLSVTLVANKHILKDPTLGPAIERAIAELNYGTVALNGPGTFGFYGMLAPWGAFPGNDIYDIQSGIDKVGNYLMLPKVEKTVVRAQLEASPYPFIVDAKNLDIFCKKLAHFETNQSIGKFLGLVWQAFRM
ncbi:MAG: aldehyde dehydrogenase family protein [Candidatus Thorarchaeota archaeon]